VPLSRAVEDGTFRADVYYRLNGMVIELPPLREREEDIALLAHHFVEECCRRQRQPLMRIADDAIEAMMQYAWPGNVREMQRVLSVAVVVAKQCVTADDLPDFVRRAQQAVVPASPALPEAAMPPAAMNLRDIKEWAGREAQKQVIRELQRRTNMSQQELARVLGVDPKTLRARLKEIAGPARQH
jgi:DNA-binding NtrC family response regulator